MSTPHRIDLPARNQSAFTMKHEMGVLSKSQLFKNAWAYAKASAKKFGGSSKQYFAEALKTVRKNIFKTLTWAMSAWWEEYRVAVTNYAKGRYDIAAFFLLNLGWSCEDLVGV